MSGWKKRLLIGLGYFFFFLAVFLPSLYFTFNPNLLGQILQREAKKYQIGIETAEISRKGLATFTIKDLKLSLPPHHKGKPPPPFIVNHLTLKPKLIKLPGIVLASILGKNPPLGLDFSASIDMGRIRGMVDIGGKDFNFLLTIANLPLDKITLPGVFLEDMQLSGVLYGATIRLVTPDQNDPSRLEGQIKFDFGEFGISEFRYYGVKIGAMNFKPGGVIDADIKDGVVTLNAFKIDGDISPDIKGTVRLQKELSKSTTDLKGKIPYSQEYKARFPNIAVYIPSPENFVYNAPLSTLIGSGK